MKTVTIHTPSHESCGLPSTKVVNSRHWRMQHFIQSYLARFMEAIQAHPTNPQAAYEQAIRTTDKDRVRYKACVEALIRAGWSKHDVRSTWQVVN